MKLQTKVDIKNKLIQIITKDGIEWGDIVEEISNSLAKKSVAIKDWMEVRNLIQDLKNEQVIERTNNLEKEIYVKTEKAIVPKSYSVNKKGKIENQFQEADWCEEDEIIFELIENEDIYVEQVSGYENYFLVHDDKTGKSYPMGKFYKTLKSAMEFAIKLNNQNKKRRK